MGKSKRQLADEAYLRITRDPTPVGTLPGQIDLLSGAVAAAPVLPSPVAVPLIPAACPACGAAMTERSGWTACLHEEERFGEPIDPVFIQCGKCGGRLQVPLGPWLSLRAALRATFGRSDRPPPKVERVRRTRGAG